MVALIWVRGLIAHRPTRILATVLGVAVGVALIAAIGTFLSATTSRMTQRAIARVPVDWQVQVTPGSDPSAALAELEATRRPLRVVAILRDAMRTGPDGAGRLGRRLVTPALGHPLPPIVLAVVHDAGPKQGRLGRLRARFPGADAVIFGHSHLPLHEAEGGFQIFNPGSPTERRRAPQASMGLLHPEPGGLRFEHVWLG